MDDSSSMSNSSDSPSDETLNRGPLALLLRRQYDFPFEINIVQLSIFKFFLKLQSHLRQRFVDFSEPILNLDRLSWTLSSCFYVMLFASCFDVN